MSQQNNTKLHRHSTALTINGKSRALNPQVIAPNRNADEMQDNGFDKQIMIKTKNIDQQSSNMRRQTTSESDNNNDCGTPLIQPDHNHLSRIFIQLFGEQQIEQTNTELERQNKERANKKVLDELLANRIANQIIRLQQIEEEYLQFHKMLQKSAKNGSNEQKWKIVVLTYRDKIQKYQLSLKEEKRMKILIQKQLNARVEEVQRLSNMNNIKFQRLNAAISDLDQKKAQNNELNNTINEMELNLSAIKINMSQIQSSLAATEQQKQRLAKELIQVTQSLHQVSHSLQIERQRSILQQSKEQLSIIPEQRVLQSDAEDFRRQIIDIKSKYEYQAVQLQSKLRDIQIEKEELLLNIMDLQHRNSFLQRKGDTRDVFSQTQVNTVTAYYNSLQDDLQDEDSIQMAQQGHFEQEQSSKQESDCQFQLSIDPHSTNNHRIDTPREFYEQYSDRDRQNYCQSNIDASFDQGNSLSNAPSRYMDTLEQLTSELAEAYQKINELTQKVNMLEEQNKSLSIKSLSAEKQNGKSSGGLFTSFFKK